MICTTACQQAHWTMLSFLQVMFCFKGNAPLLSSGGDSWRTNWLAHIRSTWRTSCTRRERRTPFLISSLTKQVLNSPNKSPMIAHLIKNFSRENTENIEDSLASHQDSEIHAEQNGNLERHEVSKIEDRVQCPKCLRYQGTRRNILRLWSYAARHHRRGQEAGRARNLQWIHQTLKKAKDYLDSEQKHYCGTIVDRYLEDEHYRVRMQTDMEEFDRVANEKKDSHRFSWRKALLQRPIQCRPTPPWRRQRHRRDRRTHWIQTGCTVEKGNMTSHSLDPDAAQWSSWSSWTWSPSTRSSWWDYSSPLQSWRQSPWPTATDFTANVLNSRARVTEHKHGATWCCEANQWA